MYSSVILVGRLTRDPEVRKTSNGTKVSNITLAVNRPYTDKNGERITDFIRVVAWRGLADIIENNLTKGRLVLVEGTLEVDKYQANGIRYETPIVNANSIRFLDPKNGNTNRSNDVEEDDFGMLDDFIVDEFNVPF